MGRRKTGHAPVKWIIVSGADSASEQRWRLNEDGSIDEATAPVTARKVEPARPPPVRRYIRAPQPAAPPILNPAIPNLVVAATDPATKQDPQKREHYVQSMTIPPQEAPGGNS